MLGNIDRRAAVFTAERQALQDPQQDHDDRRSHANGRGTGHQADTGGGNAHQRHRDQKGVFAPQLVTQISKQHGPQRAEPEPHGEPRPDQQQLQGDVIGWEKGLADQRGQCPVNEEIEPFEDRPRGRSEDHQPHIGRARFWWRGHCRRGHGFALSEVQRIPSRAPRKRQARLATATGSRRAGPDSRARRRLR